MTSKTDTGDGKATPAAREQIIPLSAPPLADLPLWGRRIEFESFLVELVPPGERIFNVRLAETFASINFAPAEGTSSLAGDRLRPYDRRPYEYIIAPPRFPLKGETKSAPEVLAFVIQFEEMRGILSDALDCAPTDIDPEVVLGDPVPFNAELAKKIRAQLNAPRFARGYLESLCIALLVEMFKPIVVRRTRRPRQSFDKRKIRVLLDYIDANLDGDLAIQKLASLAGVSAHQLSRVFKNMVGESPHNYVVQRRTDAARQLLDQGNYSLADIAFATGFSSQSHMTTVFKKVLGATPAAIRRSD